MLNMSLGSIIGGLIFSVIGLFFFRYGRKEAEHKPLIIGLVLMTYPIFVDSNRTLWAIGIGLSAWGYWEVKGKYG